MYASAKNALHSLLHSSLISIYKRFFFTFFHDLRKVNSQISLFLLLFVCQFSVNDLCPVAVFIKRWRKRFVYFSICTLIYELQNKMDATIFVLQSFAPDCCVTCKVKFMPSFLLSKRLRQIFKPRTFHLLSVWKCYLGRSIVE